MPVHETVYRRYGADRPSGGRSAILAVASYAVLGHRGGWLYKFARYASFAPPLVVGGILYITNQTAAGLQAATLDPVLLREQYAGPAFAYFGVQLFFNTFFTAIAGGPVVAEDLRRHALELYFSKPIRPLEYAFGKWLGVFAAVSGAMTLPIAIAGGMLLAFAPGGFAAYGDLVLRAVVAGTFASAVSSLVVLGVSSTGKSGRYAVVLWFVVSFFTHLASKVLVAATGEGAFAAFSFRDEIRVVAARIMDVPWDPGRPGEEAPSGYLCLGALVGWCLAAAAALRYRLKGAARS